MEENNSAIQNDTKSSNNMISVPEDSATLSKAAELMEQGYQTYNGGKYEEGILLLQEAADMNYPPAVLMLSTTFMCSKTPKLQPYFDKCASYHDWFYQRRNESPKTAYEYGIFLETTSSDYEQANYWHRISAEQGCVEAQYQLGHAYDMGIGVTRDSVAAHEWFLKAAKQGSCPAELSLAMRYYMQGNGDIQKDITQAVYWFEQAAEQGSEHAHYCLAMLYSTGLEVPLDLTKSVEWYHKAVDRGLPNAHMHMASYYKLPLSQDAEKATEWYEKGAEAGEAACMIELGNWLYWHAPKAQQNKKKALYWFQQAAEKSYTFAYFSLSLLYQAGEVVPKDHQIALEWLFKAAECDIPEAQYKLGCHYHAGMHVKKDLNKAFFWFEKAGRWGYLAAQYTVGMCYHFGDGVEQDWNQALFWFRTAYVEGGYRTIVNWEGFQEVYKIQKNNKEETE